MKIIGEKADRTNQTDIGERPEKAGRAWPAMLQHTIAAIAFHFRICIHSGHYNIRYENPHRTRTATAIRAFECAQHLIFDSHIYQRKIRHTFVLFVCVKVFTSIRVRLVTDFGCRGFFWKNVFRAYVMVNKLTLKIDHVEGRKNSNRRNEFMFTLTLLLWRIAINSILFMFSVFVNIFQALSIKWIGVNFSCRKPLWTIWTLHAILK